MTEQENEAVCAKLLSSLNSTFRGAADQSSPVALEGRTSLSDLVTASSWLMFDLPKVSRTNGRQSLLDSETVKSKVGIPNFVSGPREYIMEGEYVILAMC